MCGIAGIVSFDGTPVDRSLLVTMTDMLRHRGPDNAGYWLDKGVGLGHRRLSIIDLSHEADQPMVATDNLSVIVFNGEIYNYQQLAKTLSEKGMVCRTQSDTEVILNLYRIYGTECLQYLRGMFAFVIWDRSAKRVFAARDRVGIKPLYYLRSDKSFVFGSEIKAVAVSGHSRLQIDVGALSGFLRFLVVPQPDSIFTDIRKLEPGHYLLVSQDGQIEDHVYWSPPPAELTAAKTSEQEYAAALDDVLSASVRCHMIADVPVGAFLSGGLDSSSVVSLMRAQAPGQEINAYSITFQGNDAYDESPYSREVANLKGLNHHMDTIDANFIDDLDRIAWYLDEPFAIASAYATFYMAQSAGRETKVVLTGDGSDEIFAGYTGYQNDSYIRHPLSRNICAIGYAVASMMHGFKSVGDCSRMLRWSAGLRRRSGSEGLRYSEQVAQSSWLAAGTILAPSIMRSCLKAWKHNLLARYYDDLGDADRLRRKLYAEFKTRLVDEMLMKVDRMTMAHSLEARVPFLDHMVVETAFQQPSELKLRRTSKGYVSKYILKKTMERYLPSELIYRPKQGFNIPVNDWLKSGFMDIAKQKILDGAGCQLGLFERAGLEKLLYWHSTQKHDFSTTVLALLAFEGWLGAYREHIGNVNVTSELSGEAS